MSLDYPGRSEFDVMLTTLTALESPAATRVRSHEPAPQGGNAQAGLPLPEPFLMLSNGAIVCVRVSHESRGVWLANEVDYDRGRPIGEGATALAAVEDLRIELESDL